MKVLRLVEINRVTTARRRDAETAELRDEVASARRALAEAMGATEARGAVEAAARVREAGSAVARCPGHAAADPGEPPAVARELITMADRLVDLTGGAAPADPEQATAALRWLRGRVAALLALCEVAPITDDGVLDFMRHEVVADRPAPSAELVDHIADTVRPGYQWRHDLLRAQQVVAYVAPDNRTTETP